MLLLPGLLLSGVLALSLIGSKLLVLTVFLSLTSTFILYNSLPSEEIVNIVLPLPIPLNVINFVSLFRLDVATEVFPILKCNGLYL